MAKATVNRPSWQQVKSNNMPVKVGAAFSGSTQHNASQWAGVQAALAANGGSMPVSALLAVAQAGGAAFMPGFVSYCYRQQWLASA